MEWSRHDKVVITIAAYIIGFTTAFIAFGLNSANTNSTKVVYIEKAQIAASSEKNSDPSVLVVVEVDGLRVISKNKQRLLSARRDTPLTASITEAMSGIYYNIVDAELSRDNKYVYFCEQIIKDSTTCDPYIYDVEKDVLITIKTDGQAFVPEIDTHTSFWSQDGLLTVNENTSVSATTPWLLSSN